MTDAAFGPGLPLPSAEAARQVIPHAALDEARRRALEALEGGAPVVAVVGAAGTGKTLLLGEIAEALKARHPGVHFLRTTHDLLTYRPERGDADTILLLDEADRATDAQLASLLGTNRVGKVPARILAGLPSLLRRLEALGRPAVAVNLGPVSRAELPGFIAARLDAAGYPRDLFTAEAVEELARRSGGVPRLVNVLTAAAAFAASLDGAREVTARHVIEATRHAAGSAQIVHPTSAPQVFSEPPAPAEAARHEAPARRHLVDAAARWVDTLGPTPAPSPGSDAPEGEGAGAPDTASPEGHRTAEAPKAALPSTDAATAMDDIAIPPQPLATEAAALRTPAPIPEPAPSPVAEEPALPAGNARTATGLAEEPVPMAARKADLASAPVVAPVAIIPEPAPQPPASPVAPVPMPAPMAEREPTAAAPPASARPAAPAPAPVPVESAQPAPPARRGYGWAYAAAALLILGGAAFALERSKDAPPGSALARVAPIRAWLMERAGRSPSAVTSNPGGGTAAPADVSPAPAETAPRVSAGPPAPAPATPPPAPPEPVRTSQVPPAPVVPMPAAPMPVAPAGPPPAPPATASPVAPGTAGGQGGSAREAPPAAQPVPASSPEAPPPAPAVRPAATEPPAAPPPAARVAEAPPSPPARIIVRTLSQAAQDRSERPLAELAARFPDLVTRRGERGPSFPIVRHFFPADAGNAEAIAGVLSASGIAARVQDFSGYRPQPRPGTIEVWLP